jgi:hypothetical protein
MKSAHTAEAGANAAHLCDTQVQAHLHAATDASTPAASLFVESQQRRTTAEQSVALVENNLTPIRDLMN